MAEWLLPAEALERRGLLPALEAMLRRLFPGAPEAVGLRAGLAPGASAGFRSQQTLSSAGSLAAVTPSGMGSSAISSRLG